MPKGTDWMEYQCKNGDVMFYYNKVTTEHRFPKWDHDLKKWSLGELINGVPASDYKKISKETQTEETDCSNACTSMFVERIIELEEQLAHQTSQECSSSSIGQPFNAETCQQSLAEQEVIINTSTSKNVNGPLYPEESVLMTNSVVEKMCKQIEDFPQKDQSILQEIEGVNCTVTQQDSNNQMNPNSLELNMRNQTPQNCVIQVTSNPNSIRSSNVVRSRKGKPTKCRKYKDIFNPTCDHQKTHESIHCEENVKCKQCNNAFSCSSDCKTHECINSGEEPLEHNHFSRPHMQTKVNGCTSIDGAKTNIQEELSTTQSRVEQCRETNDQSLHASTCHQPSTEQRDQDTNTLNYTDYDAGIGRTIKQEQSSQETSDTVETDNNTLNYNNHFYPDIRRTIKQEQDTQETSEEECSASNGQSSGVETGHYILTEHREIVDSHSVDTSMRLCVDGIMTKQTKGSHINVQRTSSDLNSDIYCIKQEPNCEESDGYQLSTYVGEMIIPNHMSQDCPTQTTQSNHTKDNHLANVGGHDKKKRFKCNHCSRAFLYLCRFKAHQRIHSGEKPYHCQYCDKAFTTSGYCREHERVHTGDKPFKCRYCDKAFAYNTNRKTHENIHLGEKPFKCKLCNRGFAQRSSCKRHEGIHYK